MSDIVILPPPPLSKTKKKAHKDIIFIIFCLFLIFFQMNIFIPKFISQSSQNLIAFTPNFMNESKLYIHIYITSNNNFPYFSLASLFSFFSLYLCFSFIGCKLQETLIKYEKKLFLFFKIILIFSIKIILTDKRFDSILIIIMI